MTESSLASRLTKVLTTIAVPFRYPLAMVRNPPYLSGRSYHEDLNRAREYVGSNEISGEVQLGLLMRVGLRPSSHVLEIGCGCLSAGLPIVRYLDAGHYVGIDPNVWLRRTVMRTAAVRAVVVRKLPTFLSNDAFDASALGRSFDFVLSHSVLSHAAYWQLELYLRNVRRVLKPTGVVLASLRLAEGNQHGSSGTPDRADSRDDAWVYPGVSWFTSATIAATARDVGLRAIHLPDFTVHYIERRPQEFHDWFRFEHA